MSRGGSNGDGKSWNTAWNEMSQINWSSVPQGATILVDGGSTPCSSPVEDYLVTGGPRPGSNCGMEYDTPLVIGTAGVTIELSEEAGRNGTAVLFGGRTQPLPYCHQTNYTGSAAPRATGITIDSKTKVTIDGTHMGGIMVYGFGQQGVRVLNTTASPDNSIFSHLEVFDNGLFASSTGGGLRTDGEGFSLRGGLNLVITHTLIHDNGQDGIQDETRTNDTLNGLTLDTDWIYARRDHPQYPGEPFNDLQSVGLDTCTHADALQTYNGGSAQSGLRVTNSIIGPLVNQGIYPADTGVGWNNVTFSNDLMLAVSHNVETNTQIGWNLDHVTFIAPKGGSDIPVAGTLKTSIKYGGWWTGTSALVGSNSVWYQGDPVSGATNTNPAFTKAVPLGSLATFATYAGANFTPTCSTCSGIGSSLHTLNDILQLISAG